MKRKKWEKVSKLFLAENPIAAFIWATNEYSLDFAQMMFGKQEELIKYLDKKEKSLGRGKQE